MKARQQQKQTNRIRVRCPSTFSSDKAMWREYFTIDCNWLVLSILFIFFPNSVSLGSSAIVKVPEQVGAAKIRIAKVPRFPGRRSQARFPGRRSQARFPSQVPKQGFQARFPGTGCQRFPQVPRNKFSKIPKGSEEQVPKQGSQARFPAGPSQSGTRAT